MIDFFMVLFREGVESFLIVAIAIAFIKQLKQEQLLPTVYGAIASALLFSIGLGIVLAYIGALSPLWEGALAFLAAILILSCTIQMIRLGPKMGAMIRQQLSDITNRNESLSRVGLFAFIFLMISREGIESTTLVASIAQQNNTEAMLVGCALGIVAATILSLLWVRYGKQINLTLFFNASAIFMSLFFIQLVVYSIHEFSEANVLPLVDNVRIHLLTEPYGPEGEIGTWISYIIVVIPMLYVVVQMLKNSGNRSVSV